MIKVILFSTLTIFCAQTVKNCSQKESCSCKPLTLESALEKNTKKTEINKTVAYDKMSTTDSDITNSTNSLQELNDKSAKKTFENPQYIFIWIVILVGLYFYLRDKKRKSRK